VRIALHDAALFSVSLDHLNREYQLLFSLLSDKGDVQIEGGLYRHVRFNHRALRALWVASFAAWEAYRAFVNATTSNNAVDVGRLTLLLELVRHIQDSETPTAVPLPEGIPQPGFFPDAVLFPEERATCELAVFVSGWAMLHEIRHIKHQQEGTSSTDSTDPREKRCEELSCDAFATEFILDRTEEYARQFTADKVLVDRKRRLGVHFALFALTVLSRDHWNETASHPSMQDRINATFTRMYDNGVDDAYFISGCAFQSLKLVWPDVPSVPVAFNGLQK
jgi:hypothetical protein